MYIKRNFVTTQQNKTSKQNSSSIRQENILVIKRHHLFTNNTWNGLHTKNFSHFQHIIQHKKEFLDRAKMEKDPTYKQVIPYLIFTHNEQFFFMQRQSNASETRLRNKYALGIGGHIRQEDMEQDSVFSWAEREFHEEISYNGNLTIQPIGILNDDSNDVGKVHLGLILMLQGDSNIINIKSELKSGRLISLSECMNYFDSCESWTQIILNHLIKQKNNI